MSLDQRQDEDLAQIMTPEELTQYRWLEAEERSADSKLYWTRVAMRKMRAKARKRQKRK